MDNRQSLPHRTRPKARPRPFCKNNSDGTKLPVDRRRLKTTMDGVKSAFRALIRSPLSALVASLQQANPSPKTKLHHQPPTLLTTLTARAKMLHLAGFVLRQNQQIE